MNENGSGDGPLQQHAIQESTDGRNRGIAVLLTVPMAWGTFEPAVRYLYTMDPPVPGFLFGLGYYLVAATTLLGLSVAQSALSASESHSVKDTEMSSSPPSIRGGLELGTYLFVGNAMQVVGLKTIPSDRAAFLLQLTTIFVPLMQAFLNKNLRSISSNTWLACLVALAGVGFMAMDGQDPSALQMVNVQTQAISLAAGDVWVILAAVFYTFHCIRLERFAKDTPAVQLGAAKAVTETLWSLTVVTSMVFSVGLGVSTAGTVAATGDVLGGLRQGGNEIMSFLRTTDLASNPTLLRTAIGLTLWTGLVPVAYTICAQSYGQSRVSPTTANLLYTIQPVFTSLIAWVFLGETLGPQGYIGGALIGAAVCLVTVGDDV